ncbi:O-antigen ligase family protein [Pseudoalteromonas sp. T1lg24]|uniref:O-antigen ligase family protein n=1 Tax=Pseudoalteromonas sp. T1lg24 TaxID=2077099 RepID=UPI001319C90F|nr:O-antigen ligase family protein [Pseudoalteromonas sp. T1lg24]
MFINKYSRVVFYTLSLTFFILPFIPTYTIGYYGLAEPTNSLIIFPFIFIALASFVKSNNKRNELFLSKNILVLASLCVACLFIYTLFYSPQLSWVDSTKVKLYVIVYFLMFIQVLYWLKPNKLLIIILVFYFLFSQQIYGLYQHFISSQIYTYTSGQEIKMVGVIRQVNVFANMVVIGAVIALYLTLKLKPNKKFKLVTLSALTYLLLTPLVLYIATSKSAFISFATCTILLIIYLLKERKAKRAKKASIALVLGFILPVISNAFTEPSRTPSQITNVSARVQMYEHSIWMIQEKPILGWGANSFKSSYHYSLMDRSFNNQDIVPVDNYIDHPHNEVLLWAIELGLFGLLFIVSLFCVTLYILVKHKRFKGAPWAAIILLPTFILSQLEFPFYLTSYTFILFSLIFYVFVSPKNYASIRPNMNLCLVSTFLLTSLILPLIWFSALSAMKYTGNYSLEVRLNAKENIIWGLPTQDYTRQIDILIANLYAGNDVSNIKSVNADILNTLKEIPSEKLAITFLENCDKTSSCDESEVFHVKSYFPYANLKHQYKKELLEHKNNETKLTTD